jgi:hypothetical protein
LKKIVDISNGEFGSDDVTNNAVKINAMDDVKRCNCLQGCVSLSYEPTVFQSKIAWEQFIDEVSDEEDFIIKKMKFDDKTYSIFQIVIRFLECIRARTYAHCVC